jgi:hypothetical protein
MNIEFTWEDDEGVEHEETLPAKFEVCERCKGHGVHLHPDIGSHAYSQEEFDEAFDDEESREAYFTRGSMFDVQCEVCKGQRVIKVVDELEANPELLAKYKEIEVQRERWDAEDRAIRRMENGGFD